MDTEQLTNGLNQTCIGNPFASPTEEAEGEFFIGRKSVLEEMHRDVVYPNKISNYHVVGLPRIGKSSLLKVFRGMVQQKHYNLDLIVIYISLDNCEDSGAMWEMIGKGLRKELKRKFGSNNKYATFEEELDYEDVDDGNIDYDYVCSVAKCMKVAGFFGLVLIDEFENGLGVNCIDVLAELLLTEREDLQFIITSHHPKIINGIDAPKWKIIDRDCEIIKNASTENYGIGNSKHDSYFNLINRWEFEGKI